MGAVESRIELPLILLPAQSTKEGRPSICYLTVLHLLIPFLNPSPEHAQLLAPWLRPTLGQTNVDIKPMLADAVVSL